VLKVKESFTFKSQLWSTRTSVLVAFLLYHPTLENSQKHEIAVFASNNRYLVIFDDGYDI